MRTKSNRSRLRPKKHSPYEDNYAEWVDAATGKGHKPLSRFEIAARSPEMVLLGNLAIRASEEVK